MSAQEDSHFTRQQWLEGLLPEINSARSVLATADRLLRQDGALERDLDAVVATYAIGIERLEKLALGTAAVSKGEDWPAAMGLTRKGWGHALDDMDQRLRGELRERIESGDWERATMLKSWICTIDNDPVWQAVVSALRNYADNGRYHHLDLISGREIKSKSSWEMWEIVERAAIAADPSLAEHYQRTEEVAALAPFEQRLRAAVADSIKRWVTIICLFGFHGVLGEDWKKLGAAALPDDALPVRPLPECEDAAR
ncbi:MAG: hypothetical protein ACNYNX_08320 [Leucobacter sp.]